MEGLLSKDRRRAGKKTKRTVGAKQPRDQVFDVLNLSIFIFYLLIKIFFLLIIIQHQT